MKLNDRPFGKPHEKVLMNIAASFPSVRNQGMSIRRRETIRLKVMRTGLATASNNLYMAPRPSFAAIWNLHTTQPNTLFPTCDEVVNLTALLETKGMSVSSGK
jgi:hypothetical protein